MSFEVTSWIGKDAKKLPEVNEVKVCLQNIYTSEQTLKKFELTLKNMIEAVIVMTGSLENTGGYFATIVESTRNLQNTNFGLFAAATTTTNNNNKKTNNYKEISHSAGVFASTLRGINKYNILNDYKEVIYENLVSKLRLLTGDVRLLERVGEEALKLLINYHKKRKIIEKKELRYAKEERSLEFSKKYATQLKKRTKRLDLCKAKMAEFKEMFNLVMTKFEEYELNFATNFLQKTSDFSKNIYGTLTSAIVTILQEKITTQNTNFITQQLPRKGQTCSDECPSTTCRRLDNSADGVHVGGNGENINNNSAA